MNWMSTGLAGGRLTGADPIDDSSLFIFHWDCVVRYDIVSVVQKPPAVDTLLSFFYATEPSIWCYVVATVCTLTVQLLYNSVANRAMLIYLTRY